MDMVRVRWSRRRQIVGWDAAGHGVVMDTPPEYRGEGTGPRPLELVLYALGGCTAVDVVGILEKQRIDIRGVEIEVSGIQREDEHPHYYESVELHYSFVGVAVPEAAVERAIELSQTTYCSVRGMLGPQVRVSTSFDITEPAPPGPDRTTRPE